MKALRAAVLEEFAQVSSLGVDHMTLGSMIHRDATALTVLREEIMLGHLYGGRCIRCLRPRTSKQRCERCLSKLRRRRARKIAQGQCANCQRSRVRRNGRLLRVCEPCRQTALRRARKDTVRAKDAVRTSKRRSERLALGHCEACTEPRVVQDGKVLRVCQRHRDLANAAARERRKRAGGVLSRSGAQISRKEPP